MNHMSENNPWPGYGNLALNTLEGFKQRDDMLVSNSKALSARGIDIRDVSGTIFVHESAFSAYNFDKSQVKIEDGYVVFMFACSAYGAVKPGNFEGQIFSAGKGLPKLALEWPGPLT